MTHHGAGLLRETNDSDFVNHIKTNYQEADLSPGDRAMLDYCVKLTRRPSEVRQADVNTLRQAGFSDGAILDICQVAAYYNFVNRLADGLGVELEDYWPEGK